MSKPLHVIVIGASHANFSLYPVLKKFYEQLSDKQIPCAFMKEGPSDQTLLVEIESTERGLQQNKLIRKLAPEINELAIKDKKFAYPYFPKSACQTIERAVVKKFLPLLPASSSTPGFAAQITLELFRDSSYLAELNFYAHLNALQVFFANLDADTKTHTQQTMAAAASEDAYIANELVRI
jgi:hypothetical protein